VTHFWQLFFTYSILVGVGSGGTFIPAIAVVGGWFLQRRGLAVGMAISGTGLGNFAIPPLFESMISAYGWRSGLRWFGIAAIVSATLASLGLINRIKPTRREWNVKTILASRPFRILYALQIFAQYAFFIPWVHLVPYAIDKGYDPLQAALLISLMGISNLIGRIVLGAVGDWIGHFTILRLTLFCMLFSLLLWLTPWAVYWAVLVLIAIIFGAFCGSLASTMPSILVTMFGSQQAASALGIMFSGYWIGNLMGPTVMGYMFDGFHSYMGGILLGVITLVVAFVLSFFVRPPSDIEQV
jgi:MFS family permease